MNTKERIISSIITAENELKKVLEEIDQLPAFDISNISLSAHALRNYLTVINFTVEMLTTHLKEHQSRELTVWLDNLQHTSDLMRETVNRLTRASISDGMKFHKDKIDISIGIQNATNYYQKIASQKKIEIICECNINLSYVLTDRVAATVILDNILSNAIKYSDYGKKIWLNVTEEDSFFVFSIRDEGPGLTKEEQTKLFQKGVPLSHVPTGGESSTGYGLAIAKELVNKLGGEIWCESEAGKGACFFFSIPKNNQ